MHDEHEIWITSTSSYNVTASTPWQIVTQIIQFS